MSAFPPLLEHEGTSGEHCERKAQAARIQCGDDHSAIADLRRRAIARARDMIKFLWSPVVEAALDLVNKRRLNHAEVVAAITRSAVGARALAIRSIEPTISQTTLRRVKSEIYRRADGYIFIR